MHVLWHLVSVTATMPEISPPPSRNLRKLGDSRRGSFSVLTQDWPLAWKRIIDKEETQDIVI